MGGHGGLNILPQKKWNVYNYDNRDIVQKDKKQHAQKMRKKYESQRKHKLSQKFEVLKGQTSDHQRQQQAFKQQIKKDSLITNELKRLAQQNQHINLFENEQKLIQNRQILEYHKLKQAEWLKDKNMDYSSKFLGTYNDDSKIPWYAKSRSINSNNSNSKLDPKQKILKNQRYDMDDLTDQIRLQKVTNSYRYKEELQKIKSRYCQNVQKINPNRNSKNESPTAKRQHTDREQRERSRNNKYAFLKKREEQEDELKRNKNKIQERQVQKQSFTKVKIEKCSQSQKIQTKAFVRDQVKQMKDQGRLCTQDQKQVSGQLTQQQKMRLKRLKREQKQRKKAEQLRKRLAESIREAY